MSTKPIYLVGICALSALLALLLTETAIYSNQNLRNYPKWISSKRLLSDSLMGANKAVFDRNLLFHNQLNLNRWHGQNEFLINEVFSPGRISFNFKLGFRGELNIIFNKVSDSFNGIRISRNRNRKSSFFKATTEGQFLENQIIPKFKIYKDWNSAFLEFQKNELIFSVNQKVVFRKNLIPMRKQMVGFRSGSYRAIIDDVQIVSTKGTLLIDEEFRNDAQVLPLLGLSILLVGFLNWALVFSKRNNSGDNVNGSKKHVLVLVVLNICVGIYYFFDFKFWSKQYHYASNTPWVSGEKAQYNFLESVRMKVFSWAREHQWKIDDPDYNRPEPILSFLDLSPDPNRMNHNPLIVEGNASTRKIIYLEKGPEQSRDFLAGNNYSDFLRIMLIGTSQSRGEGGVDDTRKLAYYLHESLAHSYEKSDVLIINGAVAGSKSYRLFKTYKEHLIEFKPHVVLMNLSNNDHNQERFLSTLKDWIEINKQNQIKTIFSLEANSLFSKNQNLKRNHSLMKELAKEKNILLIDMDSFMSAEKQIDSGFIWWDNVHMTSYGQFLAAQEMAKAIRSTQIRGF